MIINDFWVRLSGFQTKMHLSHDRGGFIASSSTCPWKGNWNTFTFSLLRGYHFHCFGDKLLFGSSPTYQVAANASPHSVPLRRIFLLPLEFLRVLYLHRSSSPHALMVFPMLFLAVECVADDTKIFKEIRTLGDASSIQIHLGRLETWSQTSGLAFNEAKCKAQRITGRTKPIIGVANGSSKTLGLAKF